MPGLLNADLSVASDRQFTLFLVMIGYRSRSQLTHFGTGACYCEVINLVCDRSQF
ncbi:hypothetical protein [Microcoleus sp. OTE_8_concoct_300]|uniref:hypothetical protein n=1 Tax=Microcoleus sp. OTE_8_concoct_300 TaxID=2964710 RepID=UPI00403F0124